MYIEYRLLQIWQNRMIKDIYTRLDYENEIKKISYHYQLLRYTALSKYTDKNSKFLVLFIQTVPSISSSINYKNLATREKTRSPSRGEDLLPSKTLYHGKTVDGRRFRGKHCGQAIDGGKHSLNLSVTA